MSHDEHQPEQSTVHNDQHDHGAPLEMVDRKIAVRRARRFIYVIGAALLVGTAHSLYAKVEQDKVLQTTLKEQQTSYVQVVTPQAAKSGSSLLLPGTLLGDVEAPIYSRASGYLLHRNVDIGSVVKQGELLADIDTPDVDQQLSQALAARNQAAASASLAKTSFARWQGLRQKDAVSQQELDERQSAYAQAQADLAAAEANLHRLQDLESFKHVLAPFGGVITQRNVDVGALVNAGTGSVNQALFMLAKIDHVRAYVSVPQTYSQQIKLGDKVTVKQAEFAGQDFEGVITKVARALDPVTRTMQVEVKLANPDGKLMPGAYVDVALGSKVSNAALTVPANTLIFRAEGTTHWWMANLSRWWLIAGSQHEPAPS
jgi:RND family efflux transporter MFP subunit